MTISPT